MRASLRASPTTTALDPPLLPAAATAHECWGTKLLFGSTSDHGGASEFGGASPRPVADLYYYFSPFGLCLLCCVLVLTTTKSGVVFGVALLSFRRHSFEF